MSPSRASTAAPPAARPSGSSPRPSAAPSSSSTTSATGGESASTETSTSGGDPSSDGESGSSASATNSADGSTGESAEADGSTSASDDGGASYGSDTERIDAASAALEKGDFAGAVRALGRDIKLPDASTKAFVAIGKRETKLAERARKHDQKVQADQAAIGRAKAELAADSNKFSAARRHHEQRYGYAIAGENAWEGGDMVGVAKAVERMCKGASLAQITQRIAGIATGKDGAGGGNSPEQQALAEGRRKLAEDQAAHEQRKRDEAAAREKAERERSHAAQRETALGKFAETHGKHPFLANPDDPGKADPEALDEAFSLYERQWSEWKGGKRALKPTPKAVLDELHGREVRRLKRLGIDPRGAAPAPAGKAGSGSAPAGKRPPATPPKRLPEPPRTNAPPPSRDDTRSSRIALARKLTEQQTRGLRPS